MSLSARESCSAARRQALGLVLLALCTPAWAATDGGGWLAHPWLILTALVVLLVLSGIFSGSEIALVTLTRPRVRAMAASGVRGAQYVERLKSKPNRMLITILLGNNLVNIGASVLAAAWTGATFGSAALGIATAVLTLLVLVFGEIFPKSFAQQHAEGFALWMARPLLMLQLLLYPVIRPLELLLQWSMRIGPGASARVDAEAELQATVEMLSEEGQIEQRVQHLMSGTFSFGSKRVEQIMTPREKIVAIDAAAHVQALRDLFVRSGISRIPVFRGQLDEVVGVVNMRALLQAEDEKRQRVEQADWVPALRVRPGMSVDDLMLRLQAEKQQLAVVTDRQGRVLGVVTLENALEEIVGEIFDEEDRFRQFVVTRGAGRWEVTGDCPLYEFRKHLPHFAPAEPPFKSMAALFAERSDRGQPSRGDRIEGDGFSMEVSRVRNGRIVRLRVARLCSPPERQ